MCIRDSNEHALSKAGYQVSTAADGEEALRVANDQLPDIIPVSYTHLDVYKRQSPP